MGVARLHHRSLWGWIGVGLCWLAASDARAEVDFGVRGGIYEEADAEFLGAALGIGIPALPLYVEPNVEYVFVDEGDLATLNVDVHFLVPLPGPPKLWVGGGMAWIRNDLFDEDDTDVGANLIAGFGVELAGITPYVQAKYVLADEDETVLAVGVRF